MPAGHFDDTIAEDVKVVADVAAGDKHVGVERFHVGAHAAAQTWSVLPLKALRPEPTLPPITLTVLGALASRSFATMPAVMLVMLPPFA